MRGERGNQSMELALVLPVMLAILTGIFDYSWVMLHRHLAADAADVGARAGAAATEDEDATALAETAAAARWAALQLPTQATVEARTSGNRIEVQLSIPDVRPVQLVPGPPSVVVIRARHFEDDP